MEEPHDSFLSLLVITGVPYLGDQPYNVGLQEIAPQHFISRERDCHGLEKYINVSDLKELASNNTSGLS